MRGERVEEGDERIECARVSSLLSLSFT